MLSKEEIEKIKKGLTEELEGTITANECGLSTNDFSKDIKILEGALQYIEQLETDKQKLIEKLEKDNEQDTESVKRYEKMRRNCKDDSFYKKSYQTSIHKLNARRSLRSDILKILKGEKE